MSSAHEAIPHSHYHVPAVARDNGDDYDNWQAWQGRRASWQLLFQQWLTTRTAGDWYAQQCQQLAAAGDKLLNQLFKALGQAPRKLGKQDLALSAEEQRAAQALCRSFDASRWSIDQAARVGLILAAAGNLPDCRSFAALLDELANQSDIQEQIALYQGFALYPHDKALLARAGEAVRSGVRPVFAAFALRNPWPQAMLPQPVWNQMIVKTFFLDLPLWPIQGAEARANADLSTILSDLIAERTAAGRALNPEIWRMLALHPSEQGLALLQRQWAQKADQTLQQAMRLAARESPHPAVRGLLLMEPDETKEMPGAQEWAPLAQWQE